MGKQEDKKGKVTGIPLKFKGIIFVAIMIVLVVSITILVAMPKVRSTMRETIESYIFDLAKTNGTMLAEEIEIQDKDATLATDNLKELLQDVKVENMESSYAYVVSSDGTMLFHPTAEKIGKPVENEVITKVVSDLKSGKVPEPEVVTYEFKGENKFAGYYVNANADFILVISVDESDVFSSVNYAELVMWVSAGLTALVCLIIVFIGLHIMISPLSKIAVIVSRMGDLDFTEDAELEKLSKSGDETGLMARAVFAVQAKLGKVVGELKEQSGKLYHSSDSLSGNATVTAETIGQISRAVHDMAKGATSQAADTQTATESVIVIGKMVQETNQEVAKLHENVVVMQDAGNEAEKTLKELEDINTETKKSIEEIYEQTNTTNESAMKIKDAIALITSIAEETNLLSLNASIEAARAGEQGKGFAVVANQIQKLAEQSNESAMKVQEITNMLMVDSEKAVETMDKVKEIMDTQMQKVDLTGNMFTQVQDKIKYSLEGITKIADQTQNMDSARINVVDIVQSLTAIAEENAAGTEETSASVTEVSSIVNDISDNATQLQDVAHTIDEQMKKFVI